MNLLELGKAYYLNGKATKVRLVCNLMEKEVECVVIRPSPYTTYQPGDLLWVKRNVLHRRFKGRKKYDRSKLSN